MSDLRRSRHNSLAVANVYPATMSELTRMRAAAESANAAELQAISQKAAPKNIAGQSTGRP
jgi:hypothetical protein